MGNTPDWWSAVWELHRLSCSRCSAFIFLGNRADFFFSFLLQGVRVCWVWDKERRGGCSLACLRQLGDRVWVRKSILDSDWPFTYDRQSRIQFWGLHNFREIETVTLCCVRLKRRLKHLPVTTGWSIRTVFAFFLNKLIVVEQQLIPRLINIPGFFVFVCLSAQFRRGPGSVVNCAGQWIVTSSV